MKPRPKQLASGTAGKIFALRKELNLTAKQMAAQLGITESSYSKYERGDSIPGIYTLEIIMKKYRLSMDWLIFDRPPKYIEDRNRTAALEKEVQQLKTSLENQNTDFENRIKDLESRLKKKEEKIGTLQQQLEQTANEKPEVYKKTGVPELLDMIEKKPVFYYKLMLYFEDFMRQEEESRQTRK